MMVPKSVRAGGSSCLTRAISTKRGVTMSGGSTKTTMLGEVVRWTVMSMNAVDVAVKVGMALSRIGVVSRK